ncbi:hypothetical protein AVEN_160231-1 [Araneus ventricosus]|uniref:Uncharacterized protein n=1 Tax=Araneus ventricosus TaxID=182803 RepID=A0A4Y2HCE9_ARAVE|nr:hypothetical protein AVEN_160231-1 [Araneus ventricosus]
MHNVSIPLPRRVMGSSDSSLFMTFPVTSHDGAPAHFNIDVRNYLNATFRARWIGNDGPVSWPPRSPDLSSLDYFLWGHLKSLVYATPVDSGEDLVARISVAAARVREIPGIFESVRQSLHRRCQACINVGGRNFEELL